ISRLDHATLSLRGEAMGTPTFSAPEQLRGEPLDVRSDIYAVGATLYFLLTGRAPIEDADLSRLLFRVNQELPPTPRKIQPAIPKALAQRILKCLAKDRSDRPDTYAALTALLERFGSTGVTPVPLGIRFLAGTIDAIGFAVTTLPIAATVMVFVFHWTPGRPDP